MNTLIKSCLSLSLGMLFCMAQVIADDDKGNEKHRHEEKYLYVWAGDQARDNPDFLAVINFDETSKDYVS